MKKLFTILVLSTADLMVCGGVKAQAPTPLYYNQPVNNNYCAVPSYPQPDDINNLCSNQGTGRPEEEQFKNKDALYYWQ